MASAMSNSVNKVLKQMYEERGRTLFHTYLTNNLSMNALLAFLSKIEINDSNKRYIFDINEKILYQQHLIIFLIRQNEINVLQWLEKYEREEIKKIDYCVQAIFFGKIEIFKWLISKNPQYLEECLTFSSCASERDDLELLIFLHDLNPKCMKYVGACNNAILNKNFKMLKWLIGKKYPVGIDAVVYLFI